MMCKYYLGGCEGAHARNKIHKGIRRERFEIVRGDAFLNSTPRPRTDLTSANQTNHTSTKIQASPHSLVAPSASARTTPENCMVLSGGLGIVLKDSYSNSSRSIAFCFHVSARAWSPNGWRPESILSSTRVFVSNGGLHEGWLRMNHGGTTTQPFTMLVNRDEWSARFTFG